MIVCQISRGVCPACAIAEVAVYATLEGWGYRLVDGMELVEAKNEAANLARKAEEDLLLVEDDILIPPEVWEALRTLPDRAVGYGVAKQRNGMLNVYHAGDGSFLYAGNVLVRIPLDVLQALPEVVFEDRMYHLGGDLGIWPGQLRGDGRNSDVDFWYKVRSLVCAPPIVELGRVTHLRHPLNESCQQKNPVIMGAW